MSPASPTISACVQVEGDVGEVEALGEAANLEQLACVRASAEPEARLGDGARRS